MKTEGGYQADYAFRRPFGRFRKRMVFSHRCIGLDIKSPAGLKQIAALNQLFEISSRNAAGFQVTRAQHSQLARELQHLFLMVFGHGVIIT